MARKYYLWLILVLVLFAGVVWLAAGYWGGGGSLSSSFSGALATSGTRSSLTPEQAIVEFFKQSAFASLQTVAIAHEPAVARGVAGLNGAPPPPTGLTVHDLQTGSGLELQWSLSEDLTRSGVEVRRGESATALVSLVVLPPETESFQDSGLLAGHTYWYAVASQAGSMTSVLSEAVFGQPTDTTPPPPPLAVTLERLGSGSGFRLSWAPAEVSEPVKYRIFRADKADELGAVLAEGLAGVTYDDTTAMSGYIYWYRVVAVDEAGNQSPAVSTHPLTNHGPLLGAPKL